jgi:hypothetical protein
LLLLAFGLFETHLFSSFINMSERIEWLKKYNETYGEIEHCFDTHLEYGMKYGRWWGTRARWFWNGIVEDGHICTSLGEILDDLQHSIETFVSDAPAHYKSVIAYYEDIEFQTAAKKAHCEFNYNGVDLIVGKKTGNVHIMMMIIGNEMHEVGILNDEYYPKLPEDACPAPEETAYPDFLKYPGFVNICFSSSARDNDKVFL